MSDPGRISHWPRLTRFYGITPMELQALPPVVVGEYIKQLPEIRATEQMARIQAASFPHYEGRAQTSLLGRLRWAAGFDDEDQTEKVDPTSEQGRAVFGGMGIKVVTE